MTKEFKKRLDDLWWAMLQSEKYYNLSRTITGKAHHKNAYKYYSQAYERVLERMQEKKSLYE